MHLGLRLFFGFLAITGVAAFFVLRVFVNEVEPSTKQAMEDLMVDTANLLAEIAGPELAAVAPGTPLDGAGALSRASRTYAARPVDASIWALKKRTLDLRILLTDANGRVVFDSGTPSTLGADHSRWRDVARTLRGEYGARSSPDPADPDASVMYVAAPVHGADGQLLGVLSVGKPMSSVRPFVERAQDKILWAGALLLGLSLLIGVAVTAWAVHAVRRLQAFARAAGTDHPVPPPTLAGELGELARAMAQMRERLAGRDRLEHQVRALTHELKSPLSAIRGAAELLQEDLQPAERLRFVMQIEAQVARTQHVVEQMLELSKLEGLPALADPAPVDLVRLTDAVAQQHAAALQQRKLSLHWVRRDAAPVSGDEARLALALSNVMSNAIAHAPAGSTLDTRVAVDASGQVCWSLRDHGPGVPDFARPRLGERFFALTGPGERRGSGLGLAIVAQVVALHGGRLRFDDARPGLRVDIALPRAR